MHLTNVVLSQLCPEIRNASGSSSPVAPSWTAQYSTFTATPTFIGSPSSFVVVSVSPGLCVQITTLSSFGGDTLHPPRLPFILPSHGPTNLSPRRRCRCGYTCSFPQRPRRTYQLQPRFHRHPERNREAPRRICAALAAVDSPALDCCRGARHGRRLRPHHEHAAPGRIRRGHENSH